MKHTRIAALGATFLLLIVAAGFIFLARGRGGDTQASDPFALRPPKTYADVSDLANDAEINPDKRFASLSYGIHTFLWWNPFLRNWDLENVRQLNFEYVRQTFSWVDIQPQPDLWVWEQADGVVEATTAHDRRVLARLDTPPSWAITEQTHRDDVPFDIEALERYCGTVAERYKGRIDAYQIWNEPNLKREWADRPPSPGGYTKLLEVCATAIRASDPDVIIVSAGISPTGTRDLTALPDEEFLWEMYAAGAAPHFDVLGVHAPGYALPPEASAEDAAAQGQPRWARFRHVEDMRAIMVANGDAQKQIAITEMGWTTDNRPDSIYAWFGVSQQTQADYLVRAYAYAAENWRPWVGLMVTIYIANSEWTEEDEGWWWAITEPAPPPSFAHARPAYIYLSIMEHVSDGLSSVPD